MNRSDEDPVRLSITREALKELISEALRGELTALRLGPLASLPQDLLSPKQPDQKNHADPQLFNVPSDRGEDVDGGHVMANASTPVMAECSVQQSALQPAFLHDHNAVQPFEESDRPTALREGWAATAALRDAGLAHAAKEEDTVTREASTTPKDKKNEINPYPGVHQKIKEAKQQRISRGSGAQFKEAPSDERDNSRPIFRKIAGDWRFELACGVAIIANLAYLGAQADLMLHTAFRQTRDETTEERHWIIGDILFAAVFSVELVIRCVAFKWKFLTGRDRAWNLFDTVVVVTANLELVAELSGLQSDTNMGTSVLRTARIIRIVRLLRVGRKLAIVRNIKTLLSSIVGSLWSFTATLVLLLVAMYTFAIIFMVETERGLSSVPHLTDDLELYYGSLGTTLYTLMAAVTGGHDWAGVAEPLIEMSGINQILFAIYIMFMYFGLINVLNGVFVQAAQQSMALDRELAIDNTIREENAIVNDLTHLFKEADLDLSGTISWAEFQKFMADRRVKAYLMSLELDMSSLNSIFRLLDPDNTGEIDLIQYVEGCVEYRGAAAKVDFALVTAEIHKLGRRLEQSIRVSKYDQSMRAVNSSPSD
jgi:voltage-gated sodium channel